MDFKIRQVCCKWGFLNVSQKARKSVLFGSSAYITNRKHHQDGWHAMTGVGIGTPLNFCPKCGRQLTPPSEENLLPPPASAPLADLID